MSDAATLLTPRQVAARLAVSVRTVYAWIEQGKLPAVRLSERVTRIPEEAVEAFVATATVPASTDVPRPAAAAFVVEERATFGACEPATGAVAALDARTASERLRGLLDAHRGEIIRIVRANKADNVRVFGSVARGDARDDSDIDLLIDPQPGMTLFDLARIDIGLEELLRVKCDVVPARSVKERIRDRVMREARPL